MINENDTEPIGYLTESDMRMLIEVLDALEESYNKDMQEGIDRSEDNDLIPWTRRVRKIFAMAIERGASIVSGQRGSLRNDYLVYT